MSTALGPRTRSPAAAPTNLGDDGVKTFLADRGVDVERTWDDCMFGLPAADEAALVEGGITDATAAALAECRRRLEAQLRAHPATRASGTVASALQALPVSAWPSAARAIDAAVLEYFQLDSLASRVDAGDDYILDLPSTPLRVVRDGDGGLEISTAAHLAQSSPAFAALEGDRWTSPATTAAMAEPALWKVILIRGLQASALFHRAAAFAGACYGDAAAGRPPSAMPTRTVPAGNTIADTTNATVAVGAPVPRPTIAAAAAPGADASKTTFAPTAVAPPLVHANNTRIDAAAMAPPSADAHTAGDTCVAHGRRFDPAPWNDGGRTQRGNNCYAYATDQATGTFPQPGRGSGHAITGYADLSCDTISKLATYDGLVATSCDVPPASGWKVALVVAPGRDYHWYREHDDGTWSHKPGRAAVRATDASGAAITDPRTADRSGGWFAPSYTDFCGCFEVDCDETIA